MSDKEKALLEVIPDLMEALRDIVSVADSGDAIGTGGPEIQQAREAIEKAELAAGAVVSDARISMSWRDLRDFIDAKIPTDQLDEDVLVIEPYDKDAAAYPVTPGPLTEEFVSEDVTIESGRFVLS